jgi:NodT family efflux transporter outer membrane factor (OMF) lipoprotein
VKRRFTRASMPDQARGCRAWRAGVCAVFAVLATACAAPPTAPLKPQETPAQFQAVNSNSALRSDDADLAAWWTRFNDPVLSAFVTLAMDDNLDLAMALARVEQARASLARSQADRRPTVDASSSATWLRRSLKDPASGGSSQAPRNSDSWRAEGSASWELDLFGRRDAADAAASARADWRAFDAQAVRLTVLTDVARNTLTARGLQRRIALAEESAVLDEELWQITRARQRGGQVSGGDVVRAEALWHAGKASVARLRSDEAAVHQALALLLAKTPQDVANALQTQAQALTAPTVGAVGVPAAMLERRPDVMRAVGQWRAAVGEVAVLKAERYPRLSFVGNLGLVAGTLASLGSSAALTASLGPALSWRALDFGRLDADIAQAQGLEREALLRYRQTAVTAIAESDTALSDLRWRQQAMALAQDAQRAQTQAREIASVQYRQGAADFSVVLDAQREMNRYQDTTATAEQAVWLAAVSAFSALGGGWAEPTAQDGAARPR